MKKFASVVLAVVLCLTFSITAFATGTPEAAYTGETKSEDVKITINGEVIHIYYVEIEFTSHPVFVYSSGSKWNPDTYQYEPNSAVEWAGEGTVKITNHADFPVNYEVTPENVVSIYGPLSIVVTGGTGTIEKCEVGIAIGSKNATVTFKVSGTPTVSEINAQKLGEIVVTITK